MAYPAVARGDSPLAERSRRRAYEASAALLRLDLRGRDGRVPRRRRRRGRPVLAFLQGLARLFAAPGLRAAGDAARARERRFAARRICARAPALYPVPGGAEAGT